MFYYRLYKMEKSYSDSDEEQEISSIFKPGSCPYSPCLLNIQINLNSTNETQRVNRNTEKENSSGWNFPPCNFEESPQILTDNQVSQPPEGKVFFIEKLAKSPIIKEKPGEFQKVEIAPNLSTPKRCPKTPCSIRTGPSTLTKNGFSESIMSTAISTHKMILVTPIIYNSEERGTIGQIEAQDHSNKSVTSFFLKTFNVFSHTYSTIDSAVEPTNHSLKLISRAKKLKKFSLKKHPSFAYTNSRDISSERKTCCTCKNSGCVKLYCECFRLNGFCSPSCKCLNCKNNEENAKRTKPIQIQANTHTVNVSDIVSTTMPVLNVPTSKSCTCKKSMCQKKYCECFNQGAFCSPECCCTNCLNTNVAN